MFTSIPTTVNTKWDSLTKRWSWVKSGQGGLELRLDFKYKAHIFYIFY